MAVKMKDIAKALDISVSSVSRALNNADKGRVSPKLRKKIVKYAENHNYEFNYAARALKKKRVNTIGFISSYQEKPITNYTSEILRGAIDASRKRGYNLLFDVIEEKRSYLERYSYYSSSGVVGGILVHGSIIENQKSKEMLNRANLEAVVINSKTLNKTFVDCDNFRGGYMATKHLLGLGHRKIMFVSGPETSTNSRERFEGYLSALKEYGINFDEDMIMKSDFTEEKTYRKMLNKKIASLGYTAVLAANDAMAIGTVKALKESGIKIPGEISVVGFDDIPIAEYIEPKLTTVKQNLYLIGFSAADILINKLERLDTNPQVIPTELIIRDSSGYVKFNKEKVKRDD